MKNSTIWYISSKPNFPIELWKHPKIAIGINTLFLKDIQTLRVSSDDINILFLEVNKSEWDSIKKDFLSRFELHPDISLTLISSPDFEKISNELEKKGKIEIIESPVQRNSLRLLLDRAIQSEFYKTAAMEIGSSCLSNVGFFEGVFELAREEMKVADDANKALQAILDYESKVKRSQNLLNTAIDKVNEMKNSEMLELHERIKATERLDALRQQELKNAIESKEAAENVLSYSRIEEMNMDKIIKAQDKLFAYTDQEIRDLVKENRELKKKLGIPVEDE
ncbi:MAG: hypothetical protein IT569_08795 [Leptospiraceae bacterium]|nr:hypothetical protein [Leptospiraceae bacterium]